MDGSRPVAIAQDAANRDDDNVAEQMLAIASVSRIGERLKIRANGLDIDELRHGTSLRERTIF